MKHQTDETKFLWNKCSSETQHPHQEHQNINISINSMDDWDDIIIIQNKRKINWCNAFWWICFLFLDILGCKYDDDDNDKDGERWWKMMKDDEKEKLIQCKNISRNSIAKLT